MIGSTSRTTFGDFADCASHAAHRIEINTHHPVFKIVGAHGCGCNSRQPRLHHASAAAVRDDFRHRPDGRSCTVSTSRSIVRRSFLEE
jgi:hypothetical protein